MQFGHVGWLADIHEKSLISWSNVGQTFDSFPSENVKSRRLSSILKTWNNTRLFFVLISYFDRLLIQYLVVIHCHLHIGRKGIKISLGWEDRSDDYLTINRCCPNLIEGGGRKKFGFNAIFASMRCDRKRVSIISLLGIYIHSRNGMNNKKKGGKGGYTTIDDTTHVKTNRAWLIVGIYWKRRNCDKINVRTFRSQRISMHGMVSEKCVHSVYLYRVIFAWYECK